MKTQDIERMAREAGFYVTDTCPLEPEWFHFAALVAAAEREACAQTARTAMLGAEWVLTERVMKSIRARGNT